MGPHPSIGTGYGCKPLPTQPCGANKCNCNGAWALNANGSVTSVMSGMCLEVDGTAVSANVCAAGSPTQQWKVVPSTANPAAFKFTQGPLCVDANQPPSPPPSPGGPANVTVPLVSLNLGFSGPIRVRDVWAHRDLPSLPSASLSLSTYVPYHGSAFLVIMPEGSEWPVPFELAPWMRKKPSLTSS
jgi:hypothetical protein